MAKCPNCGAEIDSNEQYCGYCGTIAPVPQNQNAPEHIAPIFQSAEPKTNNTNNGANTTKLVLLKGPQGDIREAPVGFSWTMVFFCGFVPLARRDFPTAGIIWGLFFAGIFISDYFCLLTVPMWFYLMFKYNEIYIHKLISKGYKPYNEESKSILRSKYNITL